MATNEIVCAHFENDDVGPRRSDAVEFESCDVVRRRTTDREIGDFASRPRFAYAAKEIECETTRRIARADTEGEAVACNRDTNASCNFGTCARCNIARQEDGDDCDGHRTHHAAPAFARCAISTIRPSESEITVWQRSHTAGLCVTSTIV